MGCKRKIRIRTKPGRIGKRMFVDRKEVNAQKNHEVLMTLKIGSDSVVEIGKITQDIHCHGRSPKTKMPMRQILEGRTTGYFLRKTFDPIRKDSQMIELDRHGVEAVAKAFSVLVDLSHSGAL